MSRFSSRPRHRFNVVNSNRYHGSTWIRADNGDDSEHSSKRRTNFHRSRRWAASYVHHQRRNRYRHRWRRHWRNPDRRPADPERAGTDHRPGIRNKPAVYGRCQRRSRQPVKNVPITWSVSQGPGTLVTVTNVTDEHGIATATYINPLVLPGTPFSTARGGRHHRIRDSQLLRHDSRQSAERGSRPGNVRFEAARRSYACGAVRRDKRNDHRDSSLLLARHRRSLT